MLEIVPAERQEVTKLVCPDCKERVKGVGLAKGSNIDGLLFTCRKCGAMKKVRTKSNSNNSATNP